MSNNEIVDRNQILGKNKVEFDKSLRGYDTAQVDEYISNLINVQKNASEVFDSQVKDLRNANSMLEYEVKELKEKVKSLTEKNEYAVEEKERLMKKINEAPREVKVVDNSQLKELQEKYDSLVSKHRLMGEENRKLVKENEGLKRDVAHLTKKIDKNRSEINNLRTSAEGNYTNVTDERFIQVSRIYEEAIDKCEDLIFRLQTELSLAHSKAEDIQ
ncbi:DivIVA domain-containing protein [uncultured Eubacterium sp.]|uniref:DivIVA domain-containing protein n=1 Tax=uncultured Eubacterium sp. TaxID=165185 RepID=UPI0025E7692F|nr:DivIVA domain-containing protein [uncultured Eubacterium sp.]